MQPSLRVNLNILYAFHSRRVIHYRPSMTTGVRVHNFVFTYPAHVAPIVAYYTDCFLIFEPLVAAAWKKPWTRIVLKLSPVPPALSSPSPFLGTRPIPPSLPVPLIRPSPHPPPSHVINLGYTRNCADLSSESTVSRRISWSSP